MPEFESAAHKRFHIIAGILMEHGYLLGPKIGAGNYSKVRLVERISDGKILAVKIVDTEKAAQVYVQVFMPRELQIVQSIKNKHIAHVNDVIREGSLVFMVMEYADNGDLCEYIIKNGAPDELSAKRIFQQVVAAVHYLHGSGLVHRDLKCENILLKKDGDILLTDFGFSRRLDKDNDLCKTFCGCASYASPQLLTATPYDPLLNDVWALGCILFILVCGSMPYDDTNIKKLLARQQEGVTFPSKVKDRLNPEVKTLIQKILEPDPSRRYTLNDIMNDTWFKSSGVEVSDQELACGH